MHDETVQAAINNWAPRFIAQGVDYNDYVRTTSRIGRWDDWCREWCVTAAAHARLGDESEAKGRLKSAGEAFLAASLDYHFGKFLFQDHPAEYADTSRRSVEAYARALSLLDPRAERIEIPFEGAMMVGILRLPSSIPRPPLVLLLPGLDSTKEEFFFWEQVFIDRGMATFSLDGPGQGETGFHSHICPDYERPVSAVLDTLTRRPDIDPKRIGVAGVSLGGYYAVRCLANEPRIRAAAENCGPWDWGQCWDNLPGLTRAAFQYHSGAGSEDEARALASRLPLEGVAGRIDRPLLVIQGKLDRIVPWEQGRKIADAAGRRAEFVLLEDGTHVCNNLPYIYRPLTADWLKEKLDER